MKSNYSFPRNILAAIAVSAALTTGIMPLALANPPAPDNMHGDWVKHHQERVKAGLDKMAQRLEIKASQQAVWQSYAKVLEETMAMPPKMPEAGTDAASMARFHADMAAVHAKKMAQVADATTKLQEVLTPDQRKVLDQMARHFQHAMHMRGHGGHHMMQPHEGDRHEGWHDGQHQDHAMPENQAHP